jgi:putative flippase GtrA
VNLAVYLALLNGVQGLRELPIVALCGGALVAITFNFLGARYWAFRTE